MTGPQEADRHPPVQRLPEGYYLANFLAVLEDVQSRYGDLLSPEEAAILADFHHLSLGARRLYVRMLTRKGPWFRRDGLHYDEIGDPEPFLEELIREGLCEAQADLEALLPLLARGDLAILLEAKALPAPRSARRSELLERLLEAQEEGPLLDLLHAHLHPVKPCLGELWRRVFLMFFGNFEQDLATFVVADTGIIRYEAYAIEPGLRSFERREDVDFLLSLRELREQLEEVTDEAELDRLTGRALSMEGHPGVRQQRRFQGLLNELGRAWERMKRPDRALACYGRSERPPARERRTRITAGLGDLEEACRMAVALAEAPREVGEARFARSFLERQRKRIPAIEPWLRAHPGPAALPEERLELPRHPSGSVERAALEAAENQGWKGFFAENHLWRALFGLALWNELFAPVPGAFQHRFQNGPLDLGRADFYARRRAIIDARLDALGSCHQLAEELLAVADQKWGVANAFLSWRHLERADLAQALARIEAPVLVEILRAMVQNPLAFDSGFPDLFLYRPDSRSWKLWEVKGPGDSLRPEQEWWLQRFRSLGCTAEVVWIRYSPSDRPQV